MVTVPSTGWTWPRSQVGDGGAERRLAERDGTTQVLDDGRDDHGDIVDDPRGPDNCRAVCVEEETARYRALVLITCLSTQRGQDK